MHQFSFIGNIRDISLSHTRTHTHTHTHTPQGPTCVDEEEIPEVLLVDGIVAPKYEHVAADIGRAVTPPTLGLIARCIPLLPLECVYDKNRVYRKAILRKPLY